MDNLAIRTESFKDMKVTALVTAGVISNALRMSKDQGAYYEPGTINVILLANMRLSPRAMSRAVISATEAKSAALQDMDIRSSSSGAFHQATGTGTDNVLVVEGRGPAIDLAGGHTRMGELIARAVYHGVKEAVYLQNGLVGPRHVFQRLKERGVTLFGLISKATCDCGIKAGEMAVGLETLLLDPRYASFVECAMSLSDDYERGLIRDLEAFHSWGRSVAGEIAGRPVPELKDFIEEEGIPEVLRYALNVLANGLIHRKTGKSTKAF
jgi:hypothetical protein